MESLYVFLAFILGWFVAQVLKLIFFIIKKRGKTLIIVYDATNVRYSVGEHGKILNKLINERNKEEGSKLKKLRVVEGHTVAEAAMGFLLGISIATMIKIFCL